MSKQHLYTFRITVRAEKRSYEWLDQDYLVTVKSDSINSAEYAAKQLGEFRQGTDNDVKRELKLVRIQE